MMLVAGNGDACIGAPSRQEPRLGLLESRSSGASLPCGARAQTAPAKLYGPTSGHGVGGRALTRHRGRACLRRWQKVKMHRQPGPASMAPLASC